jgi:CheY-like chemotaxis protein
MKRVLVVEDEDALHLFYQRILKNCGFDSVELTRNGQEAIRYLADCEPILILLDMRMPVSSGMDVVDYIEQNPRLHGAHVVIASASQSYEQAVNRLPSAQFLLKPVIPAQLSQIAAQVLAAT